MPANRANREDQLIERVRRRLPSSPGGLLRVSVGDDAAVLRPAAGNSWIVTSDQFIDGVHFLGNVHPPEVVGHKALARATSDIAAMGGRPRFFLLSLAIPRERSGRWLDRVIAGMARAAREFDLRLAGGDTARMPPDGGKTALSITVLGEIKASQAALRSSARPGDTIFVTGRLGAAQVGLELVLRGLHRQRRWRRYVLPHYYPKIQIGLGQRLVRGHLVSAMMDLSDGLSTDLDRLCRASGAGACIYREKIPRAAIPAPLREKLDPLALALHGGEDYGLLFTVPKQHLRQIPHAFHGTRLTPIGEIVRGQGIEMVAPGGGAAPLTPRGWDHFSPR